MFKKYIKKLSRYKEEKSHRVNIIICIKNKTVCNEL